MRRAPPSCAAEATGAFAPAVSDALFRWGSAAADRAIALMLAERTEISSEDTSPSSASRAISSLS